MAITNGTYLANLFDPEVVGDLIEKKFVDNMVFAPLCDIDTTLEGRPGDIITLPYYSYIGDASTVAEGEDITISQLTQSTTTAQIHKIAKGVQITDEAALSGYGDPLGEAVAQIQLALASQADNEVLGVLANIANAMTQTAASSTLAAADVSAALELFGEDVDGTKVIVVEPAFLTVLRSNASGAWIPASEIAAELAIKGAVGEIYGCQVIVSNKLKTTHNAYIVKPGALKMFLKREILVETDRNIINKSTVMTADRYAVAYLYNANGAIKIKPGT